MKIYILLLALIAFSSNTAQDSVEIRPFGPIDSPNRFVKYGNRVQFIIHNVNPFKVEGFTTTKALSLDYEVPSVFQDLKLTKEETESITLGGQDERNKSNNYIDTPEPIIKNKRIEFIYEFEKFISVLIEVNSFAKLEERLRVLITEPVLIEDTVTLKANAKSYMEALYSGQDRTEAKKTISSKLVSLNNHYHNLKKSYVELQDFSEKKLVNIEGIFSNAKDKSVLEIKNNTITNSSFKEFEEEMKFAKEIFNKLIISENREELLSKSYSGIDLYYKIDAAKFKVYIKSEQLLDDEVTISPILRNRNGEEIKKFNSYTFQTINRLKVNFSSGYLMSFGSNENYSVYKNEDGVIEGIVEGNKDDLTHSLGGLIHIYKTGKKNIQPALSTGLSLQNDGDLGFYLGSSLIFQENNRFVFSLGISYSKLKILNTANLSSLEDGGRRFITTTDTEIKYDDVYRPSFFIGFTYNLSSE